MGCREEWDGIAGDGDTANLLGNESVVIRATDGATHDASDVDARDPRHDGAAGDDGIADGSEKWRSRIFRTRDDAAIEPASKNGDGTDAGVAIFRNVADTVSGEDKGARDAAHDAKRRNGISPGWQTFRANNEERITVAANLSADADGSDIPACDNAAIERTERTQSVSADADARDASINAPHSAGSDDGAIRPAAAHVSADDYRAEIPTANDRASIAGITAVE